MTPAEFADLLTPSARQAVEGMKAEVLAGLPFAKRTVMKLAWGPLVVFVLPVLIRIAVELFIARLGPLIRRVLELVISILPDERTGTGVNLKEFNEARMLFSAPKSQFYQSVRRVIAGETKGMIHEEVN